MIVKKTALLSLNAALIGGLVVSVSNTSFGQQAASEINLSVMARVGGTGGRGGGEGGGNAGSVIINGIDPKSSADREHGSLRLGGGGGGARRGATPPTGIQTNSVVLTWDHAISTKKVDLYWLLGAPPAGGGGGGRRGGGPVPAPQDYSLKYWNGTDFLPVEDASGLKSEADKYNTTTFKEVTTERLRLEVTYDAAGGAPGIQQWKVYDSGKTPNFAPVLVAGGDRSVMVGGKTYLSGMAKDEGKPKALATTWAKVSGPGNIRFARATDPVTTATFSSPGEYVIKLTGNDGAVQTNRTLTVKVEAPPPKDRLDVVYTKSYSIDSPLWNARAKSLIVSWIPHCVDQINRTDLTQGPGGIDNFIEAAKALRGEPHQPHKGYVFANAWVHQTVESMCIALMIDPKGDPEIIKAHQKMRETLEDWIPKILAAQEPDGYLQTAFTAKSPNSNWRERWTPSARANHEGYVAGYFIESAINHYTLTDGKDRRLYNAAKKLADCWVANIGPAPKKEWFDGHQQMEQGLVRFGRFVNDMEGGGKGDSYINLAKFLLDCRKNGSEYDQSHVPVQQQYEAVGHAVRAAYSYSGMADVATETHDPDYQSAVASLWDNIVNKKYYVTGGIGSGQTSEGFGGNYELRNNAYCESCSTCGLIFFQWKMNLAYKDAKYADLYEESMYNALLGATDLEGKTFFYTNPLIGGNRTPWHGCPCCVGNIPRTLLMVPTWTYVKDKDAVYVNMYIGSTINVEKVAGTDVQMVQKTDYPWNGKVSITVNPKVSKSFSVFVRVPDRTTSELYTPAPQVSGLKSLSVNGSSVATKADKGYIAIKRTWKAGDKIELEIPMEVQRITASDKIEATRGMVALRYGPLIYNVERADQPDITKAIGSGPLKAEWRPDLLEGVMTIKGTWADGTPLIAIPNYARNNRLGQNAPVTAAADPAIDYSGASQTVGGTAAATTGAEATATATAVATGLTAGQTNAAAAPAGNRGGGRRGGGSQVWIRTTGGQQ